MKWEAKIIETFADTQIKANIFLNNNLIATTEWLVNEEFKDLKKRLEEK